jgi:bifunctional UDP-N-acetylglucosamine pyrophosphorylase/glucosamine-1-phosphate N-acetyltransferase
MVIPTRHLNGWLGALKNNNAQGEYYLTDIVAQAVANGVPVVSAHPSAEWEVAGVNSKVQLAELERRHQLNIAIALLEKGVHLLDPARIDVRGELICGRDVSIDVGCVFEGRVELADGVTIGANCVLVNTRVAAGVQHQTVLPPGRRRRRRKIADRPVCAPAPGHRAGEDVHIGNFVEVKNSKIAAHSKANHLAYVGDADVGSRVNIGAGTITCNYDGANKFRTVIEDDAFIGSDSQLVAPVTRRQGCDPGRRHHADQGCAGRQADHLASAAADDRELEASGQGEEVIHCLRTAKSQDKHRLFHRLCTGCSTCCAQGCYPVIHKVIHRPAR